MFQFWKRSRSDKNKCVNNFVRWFHGFLWCCVLKIDRKTVGKNHPKTKWKLQVRCKSSAELAYRLLLFRMLLLSTISSKFERKFYLTQCQYCCVEKAVKFNDKIRLAQKGLSENHLPVKKHSARLIIVALHTGNSSVSFLMVE